jgi:hypothetical protein
MHLPRRAGIAHTPQLAPPRRAVLAAGRHASAQGLEPGIELEPAGRVQESSPHGRASVPRTRPIGRLIASKGSPPPGRRRTSLHPARRRGRRSRPLPRGSGEGPHAAHRGCRPPGSGQGRQPAPPRGRGGSAAGNLLEGTRRGAVAALAGMLRCGRNRALASPPRAAPGRAWPRASRRVRGAWGARSWGKLSAKVRLGRMVSRPWNRRTCRRSRAACPNAGRSAG